MIRGALTFLTFVSVVLFPWPLTAVVALASSFFIPFLPLAAGIFADTLYYSPQALAGQAGFMPLFTIWGGVVTCAVILVRGRLRASNIGE